MSGAFAYVVLGLCVPVALALFAVFGARKAVLYVVLGGMLFLPEVVEFDGPLIPPLGKHAVSELSALLGCLIFAPAMLRRARPGRGFDVAFLVMLAAIVPAVLNNEERLNGLPFRQGMELRDIPAFAIRHTLSVWVPFLLGRAVVRSSEDLRRLWRVMLGLGAAYSLLMLFEIRMSPNLHRWIYGLHAREDFLETMRWGGYRPTVFMEHGLAVGLFALVVALFMATESRVRRLRWGLPTWLWLGYFVVVFVLCKSPGAIAVGLVVLPVVRLARPRAQVRLATVLAVVCILYPALKATDLFPAKAIVDIARAVSNEDRAASLRFRFDNDTLLLDHAREKIVWGWGGFGRNLVYTERGEPASVTDGYWIIMLGSFGAVGLGCALVLLCGPVFVAARRIRQIKDPTAALQVSTLAVVVSVYTFDLLPNGMFTHVPFFFAGALLAACQALPDEEPPHARAA